jgi:hypothetical protein
MKFKVRDGFVVKMINKVELGDGKTELQESTAFAGQVVELDTDGANLHAHKLEPMDKAAAAFLDSKVLPVSPAGELGLTPEALAMVKAMATAMAKEIAAALQPAASAPAA